MMVTAVLSVVAVSEPDPVEYVDIECQPAAISVDCNNVQMVPLKLKALHRSGADAALLDVFWRLHIQSSGKDLGTADSPGASSEWEYYLPSDKWGNADSIIVEAYRDSARETLLAQKRASIVRQNPSPFPVEGDWKPLPFKYKNGEYFLDKTLGFIFMWMNPVAGNSEMHPFDDVAQNPDTTSWKSIQEYPLLGTQLLLARKIDADLIDVDNLKVKHLEGADGDFTGSVTATEGYIGAFEITNRGLENEKENPTAILRIGKDGGKFFEVNVSSGAMCSIRGDGITALSLGAYGDHSTGVKVIAQAGYDTCAIEALGNVDLNARSGESVRISRLRASGFAAGVRNLGSSMMSAPPSYTVSDTDDIIIYGGPDLSFDPTLFLPRSTTPGRIVYLKNQLNRNVWVKGPLMNPNNRGTTNASSINQISCFFVFDGSRWIYFYCG